MAIRQTPSHTRGACTLKQVSATIVEQFPRQREQLAGSFICISLLLFLCSLRQLAIDIDRETELRVTGSVLPCGQSILDRLRRQSRLIQIASPLRQLCFDTSCAVLK